MPSRPEERYWLAGGHKPVPHLTRAGIRFALEHSRLLDLNLFYSEAKLERALEKQRAGNNELTKLLAELRQHDGLLAEVILCRVVDNFLTFISELLGLVYEVRPEMLRSSEQERIDFILLYESMEELRKALAEKRVDRLSYLGLRELADYVEKQMGFALFPAEDDLRQASIIVEYRNLFIHNRGVVSNLSSRRFPHLAGDLGKRISLPMQEVRDLRQFIEHSAIDIDVRASEKFGLPKAPLPRPPDKLMESAADRPET